MSALIFGARGYMGGYFLQAFPGSIAAEADIADRAAVCKLLDAHKPDVVINCAGKTGRPNVDWCETHKAETIHANVTGPLVLLEECMARGLYLVHLSSGCIYAGGTVEKGITEDTPPNFDGSFYSRTKAWSDQIMHDFPVLNLRLRMPFDGSRSPRNLLSKIAGYAKVLDVDNSLTYLPDFMEAAKKLIAQKKTGTYNVVNAGATSPYKIMQLYKEIVNPAHTFERMTNDQLLTVVAAARSNCILSTDKLKGEGITMRPVEEAVREALSMLKS